MAEDSLPMLFEGGRREEWSYRPRRDQRGGH